MLFEYVKEEISYFKEEKFKLLRLCSQIQDLKGRSLKCVKYPLVFSFSNISLEKTLESPLNCKEIQPVHPKGVQSWVFIGRTDAKAETPVLWPPHAKS